MRRIEAEARKWLDELHVCSALWDAGFCGPESAEYGAIMMAAKAKAVEAFQAGALWAFEQAAQNMEARPGLGWLTLARDIRQLGTEGDAPDGQ